MDGAVDAISAAYDALLDAFAAVISEPGRAAALADLKHSFEAFAASCDRAEELIRDAAGRVAVIAGDGNFAPSPLQTVGTGSHLEMLWRAVQAIGREPPREVEEKEEVDEEEKEEEEEVEVEVETKDD